MNVVGAIRGSLLYRVGTKVRTWARGSVIVRTLLSDRGSFALIGFIALGSVVQLFLSSLNASMKFLSFLALFTVMLVVTWELTGPPTE